MLTNPADVVPNGRPINPLTLNYDFKEIETANNLQEWPAASHMLTLIFHNNLEDARMLYKRLPEATRNDPAVKAAHALLQRLWNKQYKETYQVLGQEQWPADLQPLVANIEGKFREQMVDLISKAYSQISVDKAAALLGVSIDHLLQEAQARGWSLDPSSKHLQMQQRKENGLSPVEPSQLQRLSEYVIHLES